MNRNCLAFLLFGLMWLAQAFIATEKNPSNCMVLAAVFFTLGVFTYKNDEGDKQ